jgi:hypothetical protein
VHEGNPVAFSQIYPFLRHHRAFRDRWSAQLRTRAVTRVETDGLGPLSSADVIVFQSWLTWPPERQAALVDRLRRDAPRARLVYLDSFASNDLRLARVLDGAVSHYFRKALFQDPAAFLRPTRGDTNLADYYGPLYGVHEPVVDWQVPPAFLDRLRLFPGFLVGWELEQRFTPPDLPSMSAPRDIDLHARLGGRDDTWYGRMRAAARAAADAIPDRRVVTGGSVGRRDYFVELGRSKLCFSPFGYGELCWRDFEAIAMGAVLVKPDMSHLKTLPDVFIPGETYVPIRWDFSDLHDTVEALLADPDRLSRIRSAAYARAAAHVRARRFVDDVAEIMVG